MAEKRSRPDDNFFHTGETTEHLNEDHDVVSTARDVEGYRGLPFSEDRTEYRDTSGDEIGRSVERTTVFGNDYTEYAANGGERYFARVHDDTFGSGKTVEVKDRSGAVIGTARMVSRMFGGSEIETTGTVPPGLASELLGAREERREAKAKAPRQRKSRELPDDEFGFIWAVLKGAFILMMVLAAIFIGLMVLAVALVIAAIASLVQFGYGEAVRRRLGPAVRLYATRGGRVVWVGPLVGLILALPLVPLVLQIGDGLTTFVLLAGLAGGGYLGYRASTWVSAKRLGKLDVAEMMSGELVEPAPAVLYSIAGVVGFTIVGLTVWAATVDGSGTTYTDASNGYDEASYDNGYIEDERDGETESVDDGGRPTAGMTLEDAPAFSPQFIYANAPGDGFLASRTRPSTSTGERTEPIPHGTRVQVLNMQPVNDVVDGLSGRWLYVRHEGRDGWVFDGYTLQSPPAEIEAIPVGQWAVVNGPGGSLNLRAWSSVSSRVEGEMANGTQAYVEACRREVNAYSSGKPGQWCRVSQDGRTGWAFSAYLDGVGLAR